MNPPVQAPWRVVGASLALALLCLSARAELSAEDLAKLAQNPVGNLVSRSR